METGRTTTIQFAQIPVTLGSATEWRTIYFIPIDNVKSGEKIQVHHEGQFRNDLGYNLELAQIIELRTSVSGGAEPQDAAIHSPINGWDVDPTMHYGRWSQEDLFTIDQDYPVLYLCGRVRCRSTAAQPGNSVAVQDGQGVMFYERL